MNIYRFNVGGGYEKDNLRIENPWRYVESFMNKDGSFDYSKDKYAVNMMKKCLSLGNIDTLIFFANSPHYTQTVTGQTSGDLRSIFRILISQNTKLLQNILLILQSIFQPRDIPLNISARLMSRNGNGAVRVSGRRDAIMSRKRFTIVF